MKSFLKLMFFYFFCVNVSAQNKTVRIEYGEVVKKIGQESTGILTISGKNAVYLAQEIVLKSTEKKASLKNEKRIEGRPKIEYFKDYESKKALEEINDMFIIEKDLFNIKWKLINEEKIVNNFKCKKATAQNQYGSIEAWYTDELGLQGAPIDYDGLPGVIVYLETPAAFYKMNKINFLKEKIRLLKPNRNAEIIKEEGLRKGMKRTKATTEKMH